MLKISFGTLLILGIREKDITSLLLIMEFSSTLSNISFAYTLCMDFVE
jgi:hypothetical protein